MVTDADGLNCLSPWQDDLKGSNSLPIVLTPHAGEMKRLLGTTSAGALDDRVGVARDFASRNHLILVLKGSRSIIASPDGRVFICPTGNAGLGTAGAGDTLTGLIAGFIAQVAKTGDTLAATIAALYIGGVAGDLAARERGMRTMVASDIRNHFSEAIRKIDPEGEQP
jgi:ADP-dependent NAD(P)H-hydrate dehydratase / NAD(P)H-hydrate epimerase